MARDRPVRAAKETARRALGRARATLEPVEPSESSRGDDLDLIRRSGFFDQRWVEAQLGREFESRDQAIEAYLDAGPDCSPHPLFLWQWVDVKFRLAKTGGNPLLTYLRNSRIHSRAATHPLVHPAAILLARPDLADHEFGPVAGWLADTDDDTPLPARPDDHTTTYAVVRDAAIRADREWRRSIRIRNAPRISNEPPEHTVEPDAGAPARLGPDGAPLVSIVMPMWNRAAVVRGAVESVQRQSHQDWELVVVDDGSTDDSVAVVNGMAAFDSRIVCLPVPHRGVSAARNAGIERARGTYLAFLDTDNAWRPDFLRVMLDELETHEWEMAHGVLSGRRGGRRFFRAFEGTHDHLLVGNHVDLNVLVARADLVRRIGGFDESLRRGVDYDLVLKLAEHAALHLVPYIGVDYVDHATGSRISNDESIGWLSVIASRHLVDWDQLRSRPRTPGQTSVVLLPGSSLRRTVRWLRELCRTGDLDVVLVGIRLQRWQQVALASTAAALPGARLVTVDAEVNDSTSFNVGLAATTGERVVRVPGDLQPDALSVVELAAGLDGPGVAMAQPLLLDARGVIASAGAVFAGGSVLPQPFLGGHAVGDVAGKRHLPVPAALGSAFAVTAEPLIAAGGLDPLVDQHLAATDLSLRLHEAGTGTIVLRPDARLTSKEPVLPDLADLGGPMTLLHQRYRTPPPGSRDAWHAVGFEPVAIRNDPTGPSDPAPEDQPVLVPRTVVRALRAGSVEESAPSLRWTIDLAAPTAGEAWGDTHYGRALCRALESLGQHVSVDARHARHRETRDFDDVILVLRGLDVVRPRPGCVNVQWVISHPELVRPEQLADYDRVYAASISWSAEMTAAWGIEVHPLLQATDPALFNPHRARFDSGDDVLFVGNSRGRHRTSLRAARAAGAQVTVHGRGWTEVLPDEEVSSRLVANVELGALYTAAGLVLNDHWEDMRTLGFVSNRLMDATASGARVISDSIPGLDLTAMFHGLVQTFESDADMERILSGGASLFPGDAERVAAAESVAAEHSFAARARVILDDVVRLVRARSD